MWGRSAKRVPVYAVAGWRSCGQALLAHAGRWEGNEHKMGLPARGHHWTTTRPARPSSRMTEQARDQLTRQWTISLFVAMGATAAAAAAVTVTAVMDKRSNGLLFIRRRKALHLHARCTQSSVDRCSGSGNCVNMTVVIIVMCSSSSYRASVVRSPRC